MHIHMHNYFNNSFLNIMHIVHQQNQAKWHTHSYVRTYVHTVQFFYSYVRTYIIILNVANKFCWNWKLLSVKTVHYTTNIFSILCILMIWSCNRIQQINYKQHICSKWLHYVIRFAKTWLNTIFSNKSHL